MVGFCGNSSFWDKEALLNNWWPQFTDCFQETVLTFAPCGWLWLTCIPHLIYLKRHRRYIELPISWLTVLKLIFSPTLCILHLVHIAAASEEFGPDLSPSFYLCKGLWAVTCALACGLILVSQKHGVASPCILFIFWTLSLTVSVIPVYSGAILQEYNGKLLSYFIVCLILLFVVLEFLLHCCNEKHVVHLQNSHFQRPCSEAGASFPSKLIYSWVFKEIYKGYKKPLELRDVVDMPHYMHSTNIVPQFLSTWKKELVHTQLKNRHLGPRPNGCLNADLREGSSAEVDDDEQTPLLSASVGFVQQARRKPKKASLYKVLLKIFWLPYLKVQFIGIMADCLVFVNTLLLNEIILYVEHKKDYPQWQGFIIAFSFLVVTLLNSMMINHKVYKTWNIGIKIKTMLMAAVYKKALTMNAESRRKFTVGTIVNLMSVDCAKFQDLLMSAWVVFSFPVSMSISFYLLHDALGLAFITGIVILVLFIPVITKISSLIKKAQAEQLKIKDKRIKLTNEVLNGIKVLKLYAWEPSFNEQVRNTRGLELVQLRKAALYISFATLSWFISPVMVTVLTFLTYILISPENALTPAKAFVAMNIFNYIRVPINVLPMLVTQVAQVHVSGKRLCDFFCGEDLEETDREGADEEHPVVMRGATFTWDKTLPPTLKNLTLEIPKGKLVAVVGQVGSGKSSLVSALLGEMQKERGQLSVKGSVAYVAQQAWIQNMTLRDNILFEKAMTSDRYYQIVDACALRPDIELLPAGEMTEIGEKGINLSGGQKQRVSLARAAYSDADLYLLDDPLSAVDAHVGRHIFEQVLGPNGLLGKKTRILVTHGIHWLPLTDHIIVMDQGRITESGSYQQLMNHDGPFAEFVKTYLVEHADDEINDEEVGKLTDQIIAQVGTVISEELPDDTKKKLLRTRSHHSQSSATGSEKSMTDKEGDGSARGKSENKSQTASTSQGQDRLIEEETSETGKIRGAVLMAVIRAFGVVSAALVPLCLVAYQGLNVGTGIWLSQWTDDPFLRNESNSHMHTYRSKTYFYLGVYSALNGLQVFGNGAFILIVFLHFVHASRHLHNHMLTNILHQAMAFFDTTPVGRILNRFSRDMDIIDTLFPHLVRITLHNIFQLMAIVVVISYSTPIFLAVAVPIFLLYVVLQKFYIPSSRQYQRLVSTTRSPVYSHFSESINGASTIRAYQATDRFFQESKKLIDINNTCAFASQSAARWLRLRLEMLGSIVVLSAALFAILIGDVSGGTVGLAITYALQITGALNMIVLNGTLLESNFVSVERIVEYSNLPQEPDWILPHRRPQEGWPPSGRIEFDGYSTKYRPHLDLVLRNLTFKVEGGEKVGIVGRTGAGKSSLSMGLFRVLEAFQGRIIIDGVDISSLGLHDVRSSLTILPQDPVLFSGTLRMNLDPFMRHSDAEVWKALENAHLKVFVTSLPERLLHVCEEGGQNLSVGQRQLVCLARSLLRKTKVLVLDEATAAVDLETDSLVQKTIREAFQHCTVLTVAHRLNTVIDYDKILVLDKGEVLEFGTPDQLLSNKQGAFYSMAKESGLI